MKIGTRSVLYGAHCWFIHPWFVAAAWWKLYGFPTDPRLWFAFFLHDLGYIGKLDLDGPEGETHPLMAARLMTWLFDRGTPHLWIVEVDGKYYFLGWWGAFAFLHSRFLAKRNGMPFSRLCVADKFALALTPAWLYLPFVQAAGEIHEYMAMADQRRDAGEKTLHKERMAGATPIQWFRRVQEHCRAWALEHQDGREDTWTPLMGERVARDETGVWA